MIYLMGYISYTALSIIIAEDFNLTVDQILLIDQFLSLLLIIISNIDKSFRQLKIHQVLFFTSLPNLNAINNTRYTVVYACLCPTAFLLCGCYNIGLISS